MNKLLDILYSDFLRNKVTDDFGPGPIWSEKTKIALLALRKHGLNDFRSTKSGNNVAVGFGDVLLTDHYHDHPFISLLRKFYPFNNVFNFYKNLINSYIDQLSLTEEFIITSLRGDRLKFLFEKYHFHDNINFGCTDIVAFNQKKISFNYLGHLDQLDRVNSILKMDNFSSFCEIGPGFGTNVDLCIQNFEKIRKYLLIDIFPNVVVLSQYLKYKYGDAVKDYTQYRCHKKIEFYDNNDLEIIILPTWKANDFNGRVDLFWNCASFLEMPSATVLKYAELYQKISHGHSKFILITNPLSKSKTDGYVTDGSGYLTPTEISMSFDSNCSFHEFDWIRKFNRKLLYISNPRK